MSILTDEIARLIAAEGSPVALAPSEPFGYGVDYSCITDLTPRLSQVSGLTCLAHQLIRRLTTERGSNPADPDFGVDLLAFCNRPTRPSQLRELEAIAEAELEKDDAVSSVDVTVSYSFATRTLTVDVRVTPADPDLVVFSFVGALTPDGPILQELLAA